MRRVFCSLPRRGFLDPLSKICYTSKRNRESDEPRYDGLVACFLARWRKAGSGMKTTVTARNFLGGFFGGVLGILVSWRVDPLALPLGVLFGVVLGWWHEEIFHLFQNAHHRAKTTAGGLAQAVSESVAFLGQACGLPSVFIRMFQCLTAKVITKVVAMAMCLRTAPGRSYHWQSEHIMNRARAIELAAQAVHMFGWAGLVFLLTHRADMKDAAGFAFLAVSLSWVGIFIYQMRDESDLGSMRRFYREYEVISRHGSIVFFLYMMGLYLRYAIGLALFLVVALPWTLTIAMAGLLAFYPSALFLGVLRGLYELTIRAGHWLCFGVTLTVTAVSWWFFRESFANEAALSLVALGAGIISGVATEVIHRLLLVFYGETAIGQWLSKDTEEHIMSDDKGYIGVVGMRGAGFWFRQNKPARIFRGVCFGTPVARSVRIVL